MTTITQLAIRLNAIAARYPGSIVNTFNDRVQLCILEGDGMTLEFVYYSKESTAPQCETTYRAKGKNFTFDRRGVEASFYFETLADLHNQVAEQVTRVKEAQARLANTESFNLGPVSIMLSRDELQKIVNTLKAGKPHRYHPSGFGTGYVFSTNRRIISPYDRAKSSPELVNLVGKPVYVSSFDAD